MAWHGKTFTQPMQPTPSNLIKFLLLAPCICRNSIPLVQQLLRYLAVRTCSSACPVRLAASRGPP